MPVLSNAKHERFAQARAKGETADAAYVTAGFSENRSNAARLSANEHVVARIAELLGRAADRTEVTVAKVIAELAKVGFSNMLDYVTVQDGGDAYVDLSALSRDQAAAIQEITVEDFKDGRGDEARDVRRVKFKLLDKRAALVDIGRHLGMFTDKIEMKAKHEFDDEMAAWLNRRG